MIWVKFSAVDTFPTSKPCILHGGNIPGFHPAGYSACGWWRNRVHYYPIGDSAFIRGKSSCYRQSPYPENQKA